MKLEEGMYVRTKYGIAKYIEDLVTRETIYRLIDKEIVYDNVEDWEDCLLDNDISKASHNIIDLIEVGDYVNGEKVIRIYEKGECYDGSNYGLITKTIETENDNYETIPHNHLYVGYSIKSIVTKEQFESMSYKVERVNYE